MGSGAPKWGNPLARTSTAGRPWKALIIVRLFARRSDLYSSFRHRLATSGRVFRKRLGRFVSAEHGPDDPCVFIGDRNSSSVESAPLSKLVDPLTIPIGLVRRRSYDCPSAIDEQTSQMLAAAFGDAQERGSISAGELSRYEPDPSSKMSTLLELGSVADGSDDSSCGLRTDAFDQLHSPGDRVPRSAPII